MPEAVGTTPENFVTTHKTPEGGSLSFAYSDRDIIANTVGHVFAIPSVHLPLLTVKNIFQNTPKELVTQLKERWKDVPWKGDVLVRVGHTSVFGDIQRLLAPYDKVKGKPVFSTTHPSIDIVARILYIPLQALKAVSSKISRTDHYDMITNTAVVYHPNIAVGMHEIGHADFLEQQKKKEAWVFFYPYPIVRSFTEWKASASAMKRFKTDAERRSALKLLEPAFATSFIPDVFGLAGVAGIPALEATIGTLAAGHFMARGYPRREQRFGYVFEGKTSEVSTSGAPEPGRPVKPTTEAQNAKKTSGTPPKNRERFYDLKPNQILEARARPFVSGGDRRGKRPFHSNTSRITF